MVAMALIDRDSVPGAALILGVANFRAAAERGVTFRTALARHEQARPAQMIGVQRNAVSMVAPTLQKGPLRNICTIASINVKPVQEDAPIRGFLFPTMPPESIL